MKLSVVVPCYNEAKNLPHLISRIRECLTRPDCEFILVDNGSTDSSPEILAALAPDGSLRSVRVATNQGYGYGILAGLRAARGRYVGWTHADLQTDPADALRALDCIERLGCPRGLYVKGKRHGRPLADVAFTVGMSIFESVYLRAGLWDINAQPNILSRELYEAWKDPPHDFSLDLFAYYQAARLGAQLERIPVRFGKRLHGSSHWNVNWRSKWRFIKRTLEFSVRLKQSFSRA